MSKPNKTQATDGPVEDFLKTIEPQQKREDCFALLTMMKDITGLTPKMWGKAIIGFGDYHYKYDSGREGDSFRTGFSPRAQYLSVYIMPGYENYSQPLARLGKHKKGKSCLNIKRLSDIDCDVLHEIIADGFAVMAKRYPS
ncbi:MAG: hypothetical protein COA69_08925 [Robiginitomaculum sp.]|nr:MAG: hypothetical protein COA69_08925 [Robiginitomaculum sp.]